MQQKPATITAQIPITLTVAPQLLAQAPRIRQIAAQTEAWINFQGLKAGWYADESRILNFAFTLVDDNDFTARHNANPDRQPGNRTGNGKAYAFCHDKAALQTQASILIDAAATGNDAMVAATVEAELKMALCAVVNAVVKEYGLRQI